MCVIDTNVYKDDINHHRNVIAAIPSSTTINNNYMTNNTCNTIHTNNKSKKYDSFDEIVPISCDESLTNGKNNK